LSLETHILHNFEHVTTLKNHESITNKSKLIKTGKSFGAKFTKHFPFSFEIRRTQIKSQEVLKQFVDEQMAHYKSLELNEILGDDIWIVKPANQWGGENIKLFPTKNLVSGLTRLLTRRANWVIQKYLETPQLIENTKSGTSHKGDLRLFVLVTKEGVFLVKDHMFVRVSPHKYSAILKNDGSYDNLPHLTNLSIHKLDEFTFRNLENVHELNQHRDGIITMCRDIAGVFKHDTQFWNGIQSFQIFAIDVIIDTNGKSWLMEINTNPGFGQGESKMFSDLVKLTYRAMTQKIKIDKDDILLRLL